MRSYRAARRWPGVRCLQLNGHRFSRYRCTSVTAMAPSPTAEATRFADSGGRPRRRRPPACWSRGGTGRGRAPAGGPLPVGQKVGAGEHEPSRVTTHHAVEPAGERRRADEDEQPRRLDLGYRTAAEVAERERLEVVAARAARHLGARADGDVGNASDLLDEVVRHRAGQRIAAHAAIVTEPRVPAEVDRCLAGGVRAADKEDVRAACSRPPRSSAAP